MTPTFTIIQIIMGQDGLIYGLGSDNYTLYYWNKNIKDWSQVAA